MCLIPCGLVGHILCRYPHFLDGRAKGILSTIDALIRSLYNEGVSLIELAQIGSIRKDDLNNSSESVWVINVCTYSMAIIVFDKIQQLTGKLNVRPLVVIPIFIQGVNGGRYRS